MTLKSFILSAILLVLPFSVFAEIVNINKADSATLQYYLKGIGEKKAVSIVKYRDEHKKFDSIDEIKNVKGIGKGIFNKIKENLSVKEGKESVAITVKSKFKIAKQKVVSAKKVQSTVVMQSKEISADKKSVTKEVNATKEQLAKEQK